MAMSNMSKPSSRRAVEPSAADADPVGGRTRAHRLAPLGPLAVEQAADLAREALLLLAHEAELALDRVEALLDEGLGLCDLPLDVLDACHGSSLRVALCLLCSP